MTAVDSWDADHLFDLVRRAAPFTTLPRSAYDATLDLLSGRYPSDEFAELRPRVVWDRVTGELTARPGAQRLAVTSGGTIPDRGLFGVFLVGEKASRVGELDEEMVYESRVGDVFALGATSWRIEDITHDRVLVSPAPGQPGRLPFWKGDQLGRPAELGKAIGAFTRELSALPDDAGDGALPRGRARRVGGRQPGRVPRRAARGHHHAAVRPDDPGRAVPRRARRLADRRALPVRRAGARPVGAGHRRAAARALRHRRPGAARRRRHRAARPGDRPGPADGRHRDVRARRDRGHRHRRGGRLRAVRLPVPRVRRPRAAAPPPRPRPPLAAVAAAAAVGAAARGRVEVPVLPDRARGGPRVPPGRVRRAGARVADAGPVVAQGPRRGGGHAAAVAVRPQPAVRLRRRVHVRRRQPHRGASCRGPVARPGAARRAARAGRAARAARPRRARRAGARAAAADRRPEGPRRRGGRRPAPAARPADHRGGRRAQHRRPGRLARAAARRPPRGRGAGGRCAVLGRRRGRRPAARRAGRPGARRHT